MILTGIHRCRGHWTELQLDGGDTPPVRVDVTAFEEARLAVGDTLTEEDLRRLSERSDRLRADSKALYLLSRRDHSGRELERKLRRTADKTVAEETVARMQELGLIDDAAYAEQMARHFCERKHYPRRRAEQELLARGVEREIARRAVEQTGSDDTEQAKALIARRYAAQLATPDGRRKTAAALARFGFDGATVRRALAAYDAEPDE